MGGHCLTNGHAAACRESFRSWCTSNTSALARLSRGAAPCVNAIGAVPGSNAESSPRLASSPSRESKTEAGLDLRRGRNCPRSTELWRQPAGIVDARGGQGEAVLHLHRRSVSRCRASTGPCQFAQPDGEKSAARPLQREHDFVRTPAPRLLTLIGPARNPPNRLPALAVRGVEASTAALQTLTRDRPDVMAISARAQALHRMHSRRDAPPGSRKQEAAPHLAAMALQLLYQDAGDAATPRALSHAPARPVAQAPRRSSNEGAASPC